MRNYLFFLIGLFLFVNSFGQSNINNLSQGMHNDKSPTVLKLGDQVFITKKTNETQVEGSIYMPSDLASKSIIIATDGKKYLVPFLRFNLLNNRFDAKMSGEESSDDNGEYFVFDNNTIDKVIIDKKEFVKIENDRFSEPKFMHLIYKADQFMFLKLPMVKIREARKDPLTQLKTGKDVVVHATKYYIKDKDLKSIRLKKKDIYRFFGNKKEEMIAFIKSDKLSINKEKDLVEIFKYFDRL